jgi:hypothetical protein
LWIDALEAQPVQYLLRAHVEPSHIYVGPAALECAFQQSELIATMGRVEHHWSSVVAGAGEKGGKGEESEDEAQTVTAPDEEQAN